MTIGQLLSDSDRYNGKNVSVEGYVFRGWEWFGIAEGIKLEEGRPAQSAGGWIALMGQPKNTRLDARAIQANISSVIDRLYVDNYAALESMFGKARVVGEFQVGLEGQYKTLAPISIELIDWTPPASSIAPRLFGNLSFSDAPALDRTVRILYTFGLSEEGGESGSDASAELSIPSSFEVLSGSLRWDGRLVKGSEVRLSAEVKAVKKGVAVVVGKIALPASGGSQFARTDSKTLYALVLADRGFYSSVRGDLPGEAAPPVRVVPGPATSKMPFRLEMSLSDPPAVGKTAEVLLVATAVNAVSGVRIDIQLPDSFDLIEGNASWSGDMQVGTRVELKARIKAKSEGVFYLYGNGSFMTSPGSGSVVPSYMMVLYVFKDGGDVIEIPPVQLTD